MADFTFNVALGREVEYYQRVDGNDPSTATLKLVVLRAAALESDALLKDYDTLSAVLGGASDEATNTGYSRKSLDDTALAAYTVDDTNDRIVLQIPTQTWTSVSAGDSWSKLLVCYDPNSSADSAIIPITAHDLRYSGAAIVPNGSNIVVAFPNGQVICT